MRHGVARVQRQVQHDLVQLSGVHRHVIGRGRQVRDEPDVVAEHALQHAGRRRELAIQREHARLEPLAPAECEQLLDEARGTVARALHFFEGGRSALSAGRSSSTSCE